jgi:hypothetical protein
VSALTNSTTTIELPRLPEEHPARYEARVSYILMGADRSLEAVSQKLSKSVQLLKRWSTADNWVELAANHDQTVYTLAARASSDQYRADLEAHRKKASDAGQALYSVAGQLIKQINTALANPRKIKGEDGKVYTLHGVDLTASTFSIAARAMQTALDLEAHSLGVDVLLGKLDDDSE